MHPMFMTRFLYLGILSLLFYLTAKGQDKEETLVFSDLVKAIVATEKSDSNLVYRLDTLASKFIPSRCDVNNYFNRNIDFGFKHHRILLGSSFAGNQVDLLCRNDTIFLSIITLADYGTNKYNYYNYDQTRIDQFLAQRNKLYRSSKTVRQLMKEISLSEEYAFYCGDAMPKTERGKYIEQLVDEKNAWALIDMLKSFNCETQAYGVAGLEMLKDRGYQISNGTKQLVDHIKKRNTELVVCYGCLAGLIDKIYSK